MKPVLPMLGSCLVSLSAAGGTADAFFDRLDQALTVSGFDDQVRARVSGLADVEGYLFEQPTPGLLDTGRDSLVNPRLTLFLDTQVGARWYAFAQARVDRGFDPADKTAEIRADEYALRFTPWEDGRFNLQVGKAAAVTGNWSQRHLSWDNPFITAPLLYENVTTIYDHEAPAAAADFVHGLDEPKYEYNPIVWGPAYGSGITASGRAGKFDYAVELKNSALSARPESWDATEIGFGEPTYNARIGYRPDMRWNLGVSGSAGPYLRPEAAPMLPAGHGIGDYRQFVVAQDIRFELHHLQVWAEAYESRFEVPNVGDADVAAYYVEAKYKFSPRFFAALRWNQQLYASVPDGHGGTFAWDRDLWRIDAAVGFRFTAHTQLKLQYGFQQETVAPRRAGSSIAAQFTIRF